MPPETTPRVMVVLRWVAVVFGLFVVATLILSAVGGEIASQAGGALVFGWWGYLARVVPKIYVSRAGIVTAIVCAALFAAGLHGFLRWVVREVWKGEARWKPRWTLSIVGVIVLMFASGIAIVGITHQVAWLLSSPKMFTELRPTTRGWGGKPDGNLREIGGAVRAFTSVYGTMPGGPRDGQPAQSWQTDILPQLWLRYDAFDRKYAWDHPRNAAFFHGVVPQYLVPGVEPVRDAKGYALSHIAGNVHIFGGDRLPPLDPQKALNSGTVMAGEVASGYKPWGDPSNLRDPSRPLDGSPQSFGSAGERGARLLMTDGSVRFVTDRADPKILRALAGGSER